MANQVYANGREVACKAAAGKSVASFPDVCFTPPQTPATPPGVPIPYPNTGMASDCTEGSKTVEVSGQEILLKDKSYFKKSSGDEAGSAPKKGMISSKITGKVYFTMWSMDVKFEGENVVRHMDMTTHNHGSPSNTAPWLYRDEAATGKTDDCADVRRKVDNDCSESEFAKGSPGCSPKCCEAKKCVLSPYSTKPKIECCDGKTKHHIVPDHCFKEPGKGGYYPGITDMSYGKGLAICASGEDKDAADPTTGELLEHGKIHTDFDRIEDYYRDNKNGQWYFEDACAAGADVCGHHLTCDKKCLQQQTEEYYKEKGVRPKTKLRADSSLGTHQSPDEMGTPNANWRSRFG